MSPHPPLDRLEFWVRFVCGFLLRSILGVYALAQTAPPGLSLWMGLMGCGVLFGMLAGWFGDGFWRLLGRLFW